MHFIYTQEINIQSQDTVIENIHQKKKIAILYVNWGHSHKYRALLLKNKILNMYNDCDVDLIDYSAHNQGGLYHYCMQSKWGQKLFYKLNNFQDIFMNLFTMWTTQKSNIDYNKYDCVVSCLVHINQPISTICYKNHIPFILCFYSNAGSINTSYVHESNTTYIGTYDYINIHPNLKDNPWYKVGYFVKDEFFQNVKSKSDAIQEINEKYKTSFVPTLTTFTALFGGMGYWELFNIAKKYANTNKQVILICGNGVKIKKAIDTYLKKVNAKNILCLGFSDDVPLFLQASNALVSKLGDSTVGEAMCSGVPLIFNKNEIPLHENDSMKYALNDGIGYAISNWNELDTALQEVQTLEFQINLQKIRPQTNGVDYAAEIIHSIAYNIQPQFTTDKPYIPELYGYKIKNIIQ